MRFIPNFLIAAAALSLVSTSRGEVVYQSDFTGTNLASAGLRSSSGLNGTWTLDAANDRATGQRTSFNPRANLYTTNSWQSDAGFTLNVTFNRQIAGARYSIGIVDAAWSVSAGTDWLNAGLADAYGIGFVTEGELAVGGHALAFNNGTNSSVMSTGQGNITLNTSQTLSITVTSNSWSYSLNGNTATSGSMTFDTGKSFRFVAHAHDVDEQYISSITLQAIVPGPSEYGIVRAGYSSGSQTITIEWQSEPTANYDLVADPDIGGTASFTSVVQNITATSSTTSVDIPVTTEPRAFYRISRP